MIDIKALKRLAKASTLGPWRFSRESWNVSTQDQVLDICVYRPEDGDHDLTGEFIAACSPEVILELIERLEVAELYQSKIAVPYSQKQTVWGGDPLTKKE